jgi:hypothetical protein
MNKSPHKAQAEFRFLLIMLVLVALLGVPTFISLTQAPPLEAQAIQLNQVNNETRTPASLSFDSNQIMTAPSQKSSTSLLNLDCKRKNLKKEVDSSYVRLMGSPCKNTDGLEIVNKSNGFSASVIFIRGRNFTTDFIDLSEGENNLEITETQDNGTKISRNFTVFRRTPATAKN